MKKILFAAAALAMLSVQALAADLPTKAPAFISPTYPTYNGFIFGIYTEGSAASVNASVPGVPSASVTTTSAAIGATFGYMWTPKNTGLSFSLEGDVGVQNFNGSNVGLSLQGPIELEQRAVMWAPWQSLLALVPSAWNPFSSISAFQYPTGISPVGAALFGVGVGAYEKDISTAFAGVQTGKVWMASPEIVFMTSQRVSNGGALRGWLKIDFPEHGKVFGSVPVGSTTASFNTPEYRLGGGAAF